MNAEQKHLHWILGGKKSNKSTVCLYQPSDADMHQDNISQTIPILCKPGTFLQRYVL